MIWSADDVAANIGYLLNLDIAQTEALRQQLAYRIPEIALATTLSEAKVGDLLCMAFSATTKQAQLRRIGQFAESDIARNLLLALAHEIQAQQATAHDEGGQA